MKTAILKLNKAGSPQAWIDLESAAAAKSKGQILWEMGSLAATLHGGIQNSGKQSTLDLAAIIAVDGRVIEKQVPKISNDILFSRDDFMCLYCGQTFKAYELSRDHVIPQSRGGRDVWENCVTACRKCNSFKGDRTPEEAGLELLAIPFTPNLYEWFYLKNRNVLADQMDYLKTRFHHVLVA